MMTHNLCENAIESDGSMTRQYLCRDDSDNSDYHLSSNMKFYDDYDILSSIIQKDSFHQREQMKYDIIFSIINPELLCSIQEAISDLDFTEFDQYVQNLDEKETLKIIMKYNI